MFVDKKYQGQGIGKELIAVLAKMDNIENILLSTRKYNNGEAIKFYMNGGFKILSESVKFGEKDEYLILNKEK